MLFTHTLNILLPRDLGKKKLNARIAYNIEKKVLLLLLPRE